MRRCLSPFFATGYYLFLFNSYRVNPSSQYSSFCRWYRIHCFYRCFVVNRSLFDSWSGNPYWWGFLLRDVLLLPVIYYYLFFFQPIQPSSSSSSYLLLFLLRIRICIALVAFDTLLWWSSSCIISLVAVDIQEGFSFSVGPGTKRTLYRFCDLHFFRVEPLLVPCYRCYYRCY